MRMHLKIKPRNNLVSRMYEEHGQFHVGDAGLDLFVVEKQTIEEGKTGLINLGISCETMEKRPYLLMPRSSISKTPLMLANSVGIIDSGYRGEIIGAFRNLSSSNYTIEKHSRLLQICAPDLRPIHVELVDEPFFNTTERGSGGFGSTGK